jgi:hypothetical protein
VCTLLSPRCTFLAWAYLIRPGDQVHVSFVSTTSTLPLTRSNALVVLGLTVTAAASVCCRTLFTVTHQVLIITKLLLCCVFLQSMHCCPHHHHAHDAAAGTPLGCIRYPCMPHPPFVPYVHKVSPDLMQLQQAAAPSADVDRCSLPFHRGHLVRRMAWHSRTGGHCLQGG